MIRPAHALSAALLMSLAGACGGDAHDAVDAAAGLVDAAPRQVVTDTKALLVGELGEAVLAGGPGDRVVLHLAAPVAELDWNIHGHAGGGTQTVHEALNQMTVDYEFVPTAAADWYLLIRNSGPAPMDVTVRLELYGAITWSGWQ